MARHKVFGNCKICGEYGKLSYEHVPPESAFNNGRFYYESDLDRLTKLDIDDPKDYLNFKGSGRYYRKKQGGTGYYTLCGRCNNLTGKWYASDYVSYAHQVMAILLRSNGKPSLLYPTYFFPLRVIKQVVTMFFSLKREGFNKERPELVQFILNRENRGLPKDIKIYSYFNLTGSLRNTGDNYVGDFSSGSMKMFNISELTFPPLGFVMTIDSPKPDDRLTDITYFANFHYNYWTDFYQKFTILPTWLPYLPGDYRSREDIINAIRSGKEFEKKNHMR